MRNKIQFISVLTFLWLFLPVTGLSQKGVEVKQIQNGEFVEIRATNPNPFPVTAEISLSTENLALTGSRQVALFLNAHNNRLVKRLRIMDTNASWNVGSKVRTATYSHAPHLHFMVGRFDLGGTFSTFPVTFMTDRGVISELETGEVYRRAEIGKKE